MNRATRLRLIGPIALRSIIAELAERHERSHDATVGTTFELNPAVAEKILSGFPFDVGITNPRYVDALISGGRVRPGSHVAFGRVPLAIAAQKGRAISIRSSPDDLRALLLGAGSIAYTAEGTSGTTFIEVISRLGIRQAILRRAKPMPAGQPVLAVANGDADLAMAPLTVVMAAPAIECAGICPSELDSDIDMSMFVSSDTGNEGEATGLIRFLADASLDPYLESRGVKRFCLPQEAPSRASP